MTGDNNTVRAARGEKWTPGPWQFRRDRDNCIVDVEKFEDEEIAGTIMGGDFHVARIWLVPGHDAIANARLIAAAPDLYEGHKATDEKLTKLIYDLENRVDAKSIALLVKWQDEVRAVLRKATGSL